MTRPRLNAWLRLFIVLTVIATLGVGFWRLNTVSEANARLPQLLLQECMEDRPGAADKCWADWRVQYDEGYRWALNDALSSAAVTAVATPLLLLVIYGLTRWILAGRRREK